MIQVAIGKAGLVVDEVELVVELIVTVAKPKLEILIVLLVLIEILVVAVSTEIVVIV